MEPITGIKPSTPRHLLASDADVEAASHIPFVADTMGNGEGPPARPPARSGDGRQEGSPVLAALPAAHHAVGGRGRVDARAGPSGEAGVWLPPALPSRRRAEFYTTFGAWPEAHVVIRDGVLLLRTEAVEGAHMRTAPTASRAHMRTAPTASRAHMYTAPLQANRDTQPCTHARTRTRGGPRPLHPLPPVGIRPAQRHGVSCTGLWLPPGAPCAGEGTIVGGAWYEVVERELVAAGAVPVPV